MKRPCDCCDGPEVLTPTPTANRPGLSRLRYRVGTYATFFETMQARLAAAALPELAGLKTREASDPSMALLEAWAIVGDVLTFYQERIANEGYLRTAVERRSVLELGRLIGYALRPGVASSVFLAYSIEKDSAPVEIPEGARSNSIPAPGEQMQAFETADPLVARYEWNQLGPRLTQPQTAAAIVSNGLYLKGTATKLNSNDPLLIDFADGRGVQFLRVDSVEADSANDRTRVRVRVLSSLARAGGRLRKALARFRVVDRFDVSPEAAMTKRVMAVLDEIDTLASRNPASLAAHLRTEALPRLARELQTSQDGHFTKLGPWVEQVHGRLSAAADEFDAAARAGGPALAARQNPGGGEVSILGSVARTLAIAPSLPPAGAKQLRRSIAAAFGTKADTVPRLLAVVEPALQKAFYTAWKNLPPPQTSGIAVHALRVSAAPFGHNAPLRMTGLSGDRPIFKEWEINDPWNEPVQISIAVSASSAGLASATAAPVPEFHLPGRLYLDAEYDIAPDSFIVVEKNDGTTIVADQADTVVRRSLAAYGLSGKTVELTLPETKVWIDPAPDEPFSTVRTTRVYAGSQEMALADEPMTDDIAGDTIELDGLYEDLDPGRWAIVAGERTDILDPSATPVPGIKAAELVMLSAVTQRIRTDAGHELLPGDTIHSFVTFAEPLSYTYARHTVKIYGNVVKATNGETRRETLGAGDASRAFQEFTLKQWPLTYVSAPTVSGVEGTLEVRVNDVEWHEADNLAPLTPSDARFITRTDDDGKTTVVFGNGDKGPRLPTGLENVKAVYRNGLGKAGNVKAGQISLLNTRSVGVKEVINPIRASGGADGESRDQARKNAPLAVLALDRLVSTIDYADFARTFGGVGKAAAVRLADGRQQIVGVTVAGTDDVPIEATSDLFRNLNDALRRFGDPYLPVRLRVRERLVLVVSASVRIDPDYLWDAIEPKIRAAMLDAFGFEKLNLGDDLLLSTAIATIQGVAGVTYVDVDVFDTISEGQLLQGFGGPAAADLALRDRIPIESVRLVPTSGPSQAHTTESSLAPAQLAYLAPEVPDTLILQELKS